jgi:undecaprenyl-diphosphatase
MITSINAKGLCLNNPLVEFKDAFKVELGSTVVLPMIVGLISTTIFSYLAIAWLLRYLQTQNTWIFVWYRLVFGIAILGVLGTGLLKNS